MKKQITLLSAILLVTASCIHQHSHGHDEGESLSNTLQFTKYTDKLEYFAEFDPLVKDSISQFIIHITLLGQQFKPLEKGIMKLILQTGEQIDSTSASNPKPPGIYKINLTPSQIGKAKLIISISTGDFSDQLILDSITIHGDQSTVSQDHYKIEFANAVAFLKEQSWNTDFASEEVSKQSFREIIKTNGQLLPAPGDEKIVTANASGIISFAGNQIISGTAVYPGMLLFTIAGGELTQENLDAGQQQARINYDKAKVDYERATELVREQIISKKEYQEILLKYQTAEAEFKLKSKNYSGKGISVKAIERGFIKNVLVSEGQFVNLGSPLLMISKNKSLLLQANVSQRYFSKLPAIAEANFKTIDDNILYSTSQLGGKIISYGKSAATNAPLIPITFEIDNNGLLIPGSVVEVFLKTKTMNNVLVIPVSSLIEEQGHFYVYVQLSAENFQKREIKIAANDGKMIQVLSGLMEGERIVSKGAYTIKLASAGGSLPEHGHEH